MPPWITINRTIADVFVSDVPAARFSQGKAPIVRLPPLDCPHTRHGSTKRGNSCASEKLANNTRGRAPTMASPLDRALERPSIIST